MAATAAVHGTHRTERQCTLVHAGPTAAPHYRTPNPAEPSAAARPAGRNYSE